MVQIRKQYSGALILSLDGETLARATLAGMDLRGASLLGACLRQADLRGANLNGATLRGADLQGANLSQASAWGCDLAEADLRDADLTGTNLRGPAAFGWIQHMLASADLAGARYDSSTHWPFGFDPEARGCVRVPDPPAEMVPTASPEGRGDEASPANEL